MQTSQAVKAYSFSICWTISTNLFLKGPGDHYMNRINKIPIDPYAEVYKCSMFLKCEYIAYQ
jgi:hypothetical protein